MVTATARTGDGSGHTPVYRLHLEGEPRTTTALNLDFH
jgi:hypothetical protein